MPENVTSCASTGATRAAERVDDEARLRHADEAGAEAAPASTIALRER